jgi:hypothetical protein
VNAAPPIVAAAQVSVEQDLVAAELDVLGQLEDRGQIGSSILTGQPEVWIRSARLNVGGP